MSDYDIHSCGYYCDRPACIKAQRDELRNKLFSDQAVKTYSGGKPNYTQPIENGQLGWIVMQEGLNIDELTIHEVEQMGYDEKPMPNQFRVYTAPQKKEWVGLTDAEIEDMLKGSKNAYDAVERIEAKLKEKNLTSEKNIQISDSND
jgi:hypothetical protein